MATKPLTSTIECKVGRPLKYETPDALAKVINEYFENTPLDQYTVTGVALTIGGKQLLQDYEEREDFKDIVLKAKLIVEHSYELSLRKRGRVGDIFALKNMGWKDKQEIDQTVIGYAYQLPPKDKSNEESTVETK